MTNPLSEAEFQQRITDLCDWLHLKWHHETDSRKTRKGWLDLVIAGPGAVIFVELKTDKGKVTTEQAEWMVALSRAGALVFLWRPHQWDDIQYDLQALAKGHAGFRTAPFVAA